MITAAVPTGAAGAARQALRQATAAAHERLHGHPLFAPLLVGRADRAQYENLLCALYGFHQPLEQALMATPHVLWGGLIPAAFRRVHRLEADLAGMGIASASVPVQAPPVLGSQDALLGTLYVREGAALGGRVLASRLDAAVGPTSFLSPAADDRQRWQRTCAALEEAGRGGDLDAMIAAAVATFAAFEHWLDACARSGSC